MVERKFNVQMSTTLLRRLYKTHKVTYKKTQMVYRQVLQNQDAYTAKRHAFALELANLIRHRQPLIYYDETSINSWVWKDKTWSSATGRMEVPVNKTRYS